ncbi:MAG: hypothetical protein HS115_00810 [Spirochaetales bacterium]|nr:hypothetical protein [Spirochaetales bacterium]
MKIQVTAFFLLLACSDSDDWKKGKIVPQKEYTKDSPREWADIAPEHVPLARKSMDKGKDAILIELPDFQPDYEHYIEKFGMMDLQGKELGIVAVERSGRPRNFGYIPLDTSTMRGKVKVFAKCNNHDLWVSEVDLDRL